MDVQIIWNKVYNRLKRNEYKIFSTFENIPRIDSGKIRYVISKVKNKYLDVN